jgi:hypothetical protein
MARGRRTVTVAAALCFVILTTASIAPAAEDARCVYPLGRSEALWGIPIGPGFYILNDFYAYGGKTGVLTSGQNQLDESTEGDRMVNYLSLAWKHDGRVANGRLAVWATVPYGRDEVIQDERRSKVSEESSGVGDVSLSSSLAWGLPPMQWNLYGSLYLPTGEYDAELDANMGVNHWAFDFGTGYRWLTSPGGMEFDSVLGLVVNGENPDTGYKTGLQLHWELALEQRFDSGFSFGIIGYHYRQITTDTGSGTFSGANKGRVTSIGADVAYNFGGKEEGVALGLKYYAEFWAKNWLEGDAVYLTLSIPF